MLKKLNKIVWMLTTIAIISIVVNNTIFIHTHILPDGSVIEHAHPFKSSDKNSDSQPNHSHSSEEFLFLSNIYHFFKNFYPLITIIFLFNGNCQKYLFHEIKASYPKNYKKAKLSRAPPKLL